MNFVLITAGEPAGIGLDIIASCLEFNNQRIKPIVICNQKTLLERLKLLGLSHVKVNVIANYESKAHIDIEANIDICDIHLDDFKSDYLNIINIGIMQAVEVGTLNPANSIHVINQLNLANYLLLKYSSIFIAMLTCPINKQVIIESKEIKRLPHISSFQGHTEYLQAISKTNDVLMVLQSDKLAVGLVTTHIKLAKVSIVLNQELIYSKLNIINQHYQKYYKRSAVIKVTGLNPHAGENGALGTEEQTIILPAIEKFEQTLKANLTKPNLIGAPQSADTVFNPKNLKKTDIFLCMYHDQGLPVFKTLSFGKGVNITYGLPYIRVSVDHGTALAIAGTGQASSSSLIYAYQHLLSLLT